MYNQKIKWRRRLIMSIVTKQLNVEGMSCSHCERAVKNELGELDGVKNTVVDLEAKTVTVEYDADSVTEETIKEAIVEAGYEVV